MSGIRYCTGPYLSLSTVLEHPAFTSIIILPPPPPHQYLNTALPRMLSRGRGPQAWLS